MDVVPTISSAADDSDARLSDNNNNSSQQTSNDNDDPHNNTNRSAVIAPEETTEHSAPQNSNVNDDNDGPVSIQEEAGSDDEEFEYEYEDEDDAAYGGFLSVNNSLLESSAAATANTTTSSAAAAESEPAKIEEDTDVAAAASKSDPEETTASTTAAKKPAWREPSREAVNMSLRAEKETSGSKRRLAQDLYRIMNKDTEETGFSLSPSKEDCMDKWTIKLFQFDAESNLAKDMLVLGLDAIQLEMSFPDQYPFEPPFVRVVRPRFKRQTGFVMNGAICMELLTKEGWNPINDIESVIVSIRSLLVVGEGRLEAAFNLTETKYKSLLETAEAVKTASKKSDSDGEDEEDRSDESHSNDGAKRARKNSNGDHHVVAAAELSEQQRKLLRADAKYSEADAKAAYEHLSSYHKKKGWDTSGWWARKG